MSGAHIALAKAKKELARIKGEMTRLENRSEILTRLTLWLWENHFKVLDEWHQYEHEEGEE